MSIIFYLASIVGANWLSTAFAPFQVGIFAVAPGTFLIAATFVLRDLVQNRLGRRKTYGLIVLALALSALTTALMGDSLAIVKASALAFAVSETSDTEVYTWLRLPMSLRVWWSGLVSGVLDSGIFVVVGLGPWGAHWIGWSAMPATIIAQAVVKTAMCGIGASGVAMYWRLAR